MYWLFLIFLQLSFNEGAICNIEDYGAIGDAKTDNTKSIQTAITACSVNSTLLIPAGTFLTYPLSLNGLSAFTLQITGTLRAGVIDNWPVVNNTNYVDFFLVTNSDNITITGNGVFDGQGLPWWIAFMAKQLKYARPKFIRIQKSSNVKLFNFHVLNSPEFNVLLEGVTGAEIAFLNVTDEWYNGGKEEPRNTDGIDLSANSRDIHLHDNYISNGDDSVAIKPGSIDGGCTTNILVENCQFHNGHGASIGSVADGCVQNVIFRNITIDNQMEACRLKYWAGGDRVGFIKNITWENIVINNTDKCIHIDGNYSAFNVEKSNIIPNAGIQVSDIYFKNIVGTNCHYPAQFNCQSYAPCENINLENINVESGAIEKKMECQNAHGTASGTIDPPSCLTTTNEILW